jgi:hypothetical protein
VGNILNLPPGVSPVERSLELAGLLQQANADRQELIARVRVLEETIQSRDRSLSEATRAVRNATAEVVYCRRDLREATEELKQQRARVKQTEQEAFDSLQAILRLLQKMDSESKYR